MTEQENRNLEEKETKNKFWKGVLVGALVTAFSGLIAVGMAAGIWTLARGSNANHSTQASDAENAGQQNGPDMAKIGPKLGYIQQLIDRYDLFLDD